MSTLYHTELIEHYKTSPYRKKIKAPTITSSALNPACGDEISISLSVHNEVITDIGFEGTGCVISQATTSILCEEILGKNINTVPKLNSHDILQLIKIELGPVRVKCALLSLQVLQSGLIEWRKP